MITNAKGTGDKAVFLEGDVGRQIIIDIVGIKYNNMYFQFEPGVCVCKVEL